MSLSYRRILSPIQAMPDPRSAFTTRSRPPVFSILSHPIPILVHTISQPTIPHALQATFQTILSSPVDHRSFGALSVHTTFVFPLLSLGPRSIPLPATSENIKLLESSQEPPHHPEPARLEPIAQIPCISTSPGRTPCRRCRLRLEAPARKRQ